MKLFQTINDLSDPVQAEIARQRRYGVIEMVDGQLVGIHFRPFPKQVTIWQALLVGQWCHKYRAGDRCRLYFNQPLRHPNYLSLKYVLSNRDTKLASALGALRVLDEVARIKQSDAILADAANLRISPRLLNRLGWERHTASRWHRNYIRRFYGQYTSDERLSAESSSLSSRPPSLAAHTASGTQC
ncbi:MAG: hypothetical protein SGJ20_05390 [Planctomycetota bacterium]|nr:hypothetical protein [Planctomycetota bacterium]